MKTIPVRCVFANDYIGEITVPKNKFGGCLIALKFIPRIWGAAWRAKFRHHNPIGFRCNHTESNDGGMIFTVNPYFK